MAEGAESELQTIQRFTRVYSDTYAALPTTNVREESLAYAME